MFVLLWQHAALIVIPFAVQSYNLDIDIFSHRGGTLQLIPEHSIASYAVGASQGAHYLEPDLLLSKDGELIVMHGLELSMTTDIASHPEFANRYRTITVWQRGDPQNHTDTQPSSIINIAANITGWFVHDFILEELKTLRKRSNIHPYDSPFNNIWQILTFNESLEITTNLSKILGRSLGIIPETKHSEWYQHIGFEQFEYKVLESLRKYGFVYMEDGYYVANNLYNFKDKINRSSVILQSFAAESLHRFDALTKGFVPSMFLMGSADFVEESSIEKEVIEWILSFADIIACGKTNVDYLVDARNMYRDLQFDIGCYTSLDDVNEYIRFMDQGVNGVFSDDVSTARVVKDMFTELMTNNNSILSSFCNGVYQEDDIKKIETKWAVIGGIIALICGICFGLLVFYCWYRYKLNQLMSSYRNVTDNTNKI